MLTLNDEKIVQKIKEYDKNFEADNYVYACIDGGIKKKGHSNILLTIVIVLVIFLAIIIDGPTYIAAIVGGIVGFTVAMMNDYCIIIPNKKGIKMYVFNKLMSKVVKDLEISYADMEVTKKKKKSIWHTLIITTPENNFKLVLSEKTLGLKMQTINSQNFIEKLNHQK